VLCFNGRSSKLLGGLLKLFLGSACWDSAAFVKSSLVFNFDMNLSCFLLRIVGLSLAIALAIHRIVHHASLGVAHLSRLQEWILIASSWTLCVDDLRWLAAHALDKVVSGWSLLVDNAAPNDA
jgi:hypothetical protein